MKTFIKISYIFTWIWFICIILLFSFVIEKFSWTEFIVFIVCLIVTYFSGRIIILFKNLYEEDTKQDTN